MVFSRGFHSIKKKTTGIPNKLTHLEEFINLKEIGGTDALKEGRLDKLSN